MSLFTSLLFSCKDNYIYDDQEPDWLGSDILNTLKTRGDFTVTVKLIQDLGYDEVLGLTGSKTLFAAKDDAYKEFFSNNNWGVTKYEDLSLSQKKMLFNYSMLNNGYTLKMLSNYNSSGILIENFAMRQTSSLASIDTLAHEFNDQLPTSPVWNYYRDKGIYLEKDNTVKPVVYFTNSFLTKNSLTAEDFSSLTNGETRDAEDVFVLNNKVIEGNVRCKNGYVHVLRHVLVPPNNMAEYIHENPSTQIFSRLLDRFCIPYYDSKNTDLYKTLHPSFTDSIFSKTYMASEATGGWPYYIKNGVRTVSPNLLPYSPGWNAYATKELESDMAAMFVPTDEAMTSYLNSPIGAILKDRFGSWENIPDNIVLPFLKRHMRTSLLESLPSKFDKMVDAQNYRLPVESGQISDSYTAVNGKVYVTSAVYPPVDYLSVYSPVLLSANSKVMNWAINISETATDGSSFAFYKLYLNSLVSKYALFIPTDEYFSKYIDPISYAQDVSGVLKYWYNSTTNAVNATVYKYDKTNDIVGDSISVITDGTFLKNRLWNLLDNHIIVGGVNATDKYFLTKGNDIIKVDGSGSSMVVKGAGDMDKNTQCNVTNVFQQDNGTTYFIDKQIQPSLRSVYKSLAAHPEFSAFFNLLLGVPESYVNQIFAIQGLDYRIKFFNAYHYTIYVPTNDAIQAAIDNGTIVPWATINAMVSGADQTAAIEKMVKFLKYHFQDNAVLFGQNINEQYQSATIKTTDTQTYYNTSKNKYYKLGIKGTSNSLVITMDSKSGSTLRTANVLTANGLYNIIAKDYIFDKVPTLYKNIDGSGSTSGAGFVGSRITTSASAVIHQIDNVLTFE
jgi:uncharacterized surface protein with fasciclin (FAS1) repeats